MSKILILFITGMMLFGCSILQAPGKAQVPTTVCPGTISITGPPEINLKDLDLEWLLKYIDSTHQEKLDSDAIVIYDLKDAVIELKRDYEEQMQMMQDNWAKERSMYLEDRKLLLLNKALKKPK